jgi:tRNA U34 5-methylaminomethyl-2-thiouridine-forming methyltransferase MnmC
MRPLPKNLEIHATADGSPTLSWRRADGYEEKMHHSGGALEESIYIYLHALKTALDAGEVPHVLSVGLGLGYNELLTLGEFLKRDRKDWQIWSFEAHPRLRAEFEGWLRRDVDESELGLIYSDVLRRVAARLQIDPVRLKSASRQAHEDGRLQLRLSFPEDIDGIHDVNLVYYDAYSKKMDPHLWDEQCLIARLGPLLREKCILATYAATGSLNRALRHLGFCLHPKPGFLGKRESTLAIRHNYPALF